MTEFRLDFRYVLVTALSVLATFLLHEYAHWLVGELLGNDMRMRLNVAYPVAGNYLQPWHATVISAAGPIITILQALLVFILLQKRSTHLLFPFLLTPLVMRFLAMVMNVINPNDEGRISESLGLGLFTLPLIVCGVLFVLVYRASRQRRYPKKLVFLSVVFIIFFSSVLILSDQFYKITIL